MFFQTLSFLEWNPFYIISISVDGDHGLRDGYKTGQDSRASCCVVRKIILMPEETRAMSCGVGREQEVVK